MSNLNQRILEKSIRHQFNLQRYSSKLVADMLGLLNSVDDDLEAKIRSRLETAPSGAATTRRLQQLLEEIRELNATAMGKVSAALPNRLERFAIVEEQTQRDLIEEPIGDVLGYHFRLKKVSADTLRGIVKSAPWEGRLLKEHFENLGASRSAKIINRVTVGLAQGSTTEEIVRSIMGRRVRGGTRSEPLYEGGVLNDSRKNVTSLVRTYASIVANDTRDDLFRANSDVISGQMWVSTLDDNTTPFCQGRDGQLYDLDHNPIGGAGLSWEAGPGRSHWGCRSTSVPVLKALAELPIDWSKVGRGRGQRAAVNRDEMGNFVNGQAPESSDYTSWLRSQPQRVQEDVLGKSRAKWFAENADATVGQAWAQSFKIRKDDHLTLRQLSAKAKEDPATQRSMREIRAAADLTTGDLGEVEQALLGESRASAFLFGSNGKRLQVIDGRRSQVSIPDSVSSLMRGGTLTHNHTNGRSFSSSDLTYASRFDLGEMRAVGMNPAGQSYRYVARPGEGGWPSVDSILSEVDRLEPIVTDYFVRRILAGEITAEEAEMLHDSELMKRLGQRLGFFYSRRGIR